MLTGIYTFRMLFMVFGGEPSAFVREHFHALKKDVVGHLDGLDGRDARRAGDVRRLDPVRAVLDADLELPRARRAVRSWRHPGSQEAVSSICGVVAGAFGIWIAWSIYSRRSIEVPRYAAVQNVLEHKFYFDELYDLVFYKPAVALSPGSLAWFDRGAAFASVGSSRTSSAGSDRHEPYPDRARPPVRAGDRGRRRRHRNRLRGAALMITALILIPVGGALLLWLIPFSRFWTGALAFLISLVEVGLWIDMLVRFDFSGGIQFEAQQTWFSDLNVSYHVGFYGFSLWLAGLAVVVMACAVGYAFWTGRERARAYFGLMLLLTGGDRRRVRLAGSPPLLRLLGGDADPALRARRRVGRAGPDGRDAQVRHLHDGRARC